MCMHTPEKKINIKESLTLEIWAAKDITFNYFWLWAGFHDDTDRGTAALVRQVNHTVRSGYGQQEMCCSKPQQWWAPLYLPESY